MNDVNLLPEEEVVTIEQGRFKAKSLLAAIIITLIFAAGMIGVNSYGSFLGLQKNSWEGRRSAAIAKQESFGKLASDLAALKLKADGIGRIQATRFDFPESFRYVLAAVPPGIKLGSLVLKDNGNMGIELTSTDKSQVSSFLVKLSADPKIKEAKLAGLSLSDDTAKAKSYSFNISAKYGGDAKDTTIK